MCGRYALTLPLEAVRALFAAEAPDQPFPPRYNIAPTQPIPVVHPGGDGGRVLTLMRWGLLPSWVKDPASFTLLINARIETAADKPAFRAAMRRRRCLVPASGFYEWQKRGTGPKQPYLLKPSGEPLFAFAGIHETWTGPDGEEMDTACILTRDANAALAPIHDRMPVVVPPEAWAAWLDCADVDVAEALGLLEPTPDDYFEAIPVGTAVNSARNEGPHLQAPLDAEAPPAPRKAADTGRGGADGKGQLDLL